MRLNYYETPPDLIHIRGTLSKTKNYQGEMNGTQMHGRGILRVKPELIYEGIFDHDEIVWGSVFKL